LLLTEPIGEVLLSLSVNVLYGLHLICRFRKPSLGLDALAVVAELGAGFGAEKHEEVIGDGGVRLGQRALDVRASGNHGGR
jgi:hypothetical protein